MKQQRHLASVSWLGALALAALLGPAALAAQEIEPSYGYFRTLEGSARLTGAAEPEAIDIEANYPVLDGDRVWVTPGARLEAVLPDGSIVRMGGGTDLYLDRLAASYESEESEGNRLRLFEGEIQVLIDSALPGVEPTRVETESATLYLPAAGAYRITADADGWTEVVVREGYVEVATERGSSLVRAGEAAVIEGRGRGGVSLVAAGNLDRLELWGESLTAEALPAVATPHVARPLRYAAAPLARHGAWVSVGGAYAWRPQVSFGWRPYTVGRWIYTPAGITWVSHDPWGWVTSHYGSWDYAPGFGWVWYPGHVYSPAWVYWYWGPSHVAWVPSGFYTRYYGHHGFDLGFGFRYGVYGWAGGHWGLWSRWTFCPTRYFGHPHYRSYWRTGAELSRGGRLNVVPRGVITNDTRSLRPERWARPREAIFALEDDYRRTRKVVSAAGTRSLPDVTAFVARQKELASEARTAVFKSKLDGRPVSRMPAERSASGGAISRSSSPLAEQAAPWRTEKVVRRDAGSSSRTRAGSESRGGGEVRSSSVGLRRDAADPRGGVGSDRSPVIGGGLRPAPGGSDATPSPRTRVETRPGSVGSSTRPLKGDSAPRASSPGAPPSPRDGAGSGLASDARRVSPEGSASGYVPRAIPPSPRFSSPSGRTDAAPLTRQPIERPSETPLVQRIVGGARSSGAPPSPGASSSSGRPSTEVRRPSSGSSGRSSGSSSVRRPSSRSSSSGSVQRSSPSRSRSSARSSSPSRSSSRASGGSSSSSGRSKSKSRPKG